MTMAMTGVVLTRTVALRILVALTDEMKRMKCKPRRRPSKKILSRLTLRILSSKCTRNKTAKTVRTSEATTRRPMAIDKTLKVGRSLMKIAADPKKRPALKPSRIAVLLPRDSCWDKNAHFGQNCYVELAPNQF